MHAAYGTVILYKSSWLPVDTQLECGHGKGLLFACLILKAQF